MNSNNSSTDDRLKFREAVGATAIIAVAAFGIAATFAVRAILCASVDAINHLKKKGDQHVH